MPNNLKFENETFSVGKFIDYKNMLRDYYIYGYKTPDDYPKPEPRDQSAGAQNKSNFTQKYVNYFYHMSNILGEYFNWSKWPQKRMFATADSQSMSLNPFQKIYKYCTYTDLDVAYFFHIIAALSCSFTLNGTQEYGQIDALGLKAFDVRYESLKDAIKYNEALTTAQLNCFFPNGIASDKLFSGKHDTMHDHLTNLSTIGFVNSWQERPGTNHKWSLSGITWKSVVKAGEKADPDFELHLMTAIDFYSRSFILGEVGTFLLDRACTEWETPFRFKHEYFIQSLNDFVLSDLLAAIEEEKWCRISSIHGISGVRTRLLCCPLEIYIGTEQGKEFLFYYEPFSRNYAFMRLEFIVSIEVFDVSDVSILLNTRKEEFSSDIENAKLSISNYWEPSASYCTEPHDVCPGSLHTINLCICYDPDKEYYILNRLKRECRNGSVWVDKTNKCLIHFEIRVMDPYELLPWIRSLYSHIISCDGLEFTGFSLSDDIESYYNIWISNEFSKKNLSAQSVRYVGSIPFLFDKKLDEMRDNSLPGKKYIMNAHSQLFHEVFSIDFHMFADIFTEICSRDSMTESELDEVVAHFLEQYKSETLETENTIHRRVLTIREENNIRAKQVKRFFLENDFLLKPDYDNTKKYKPKYKIKKGSDFYKVILPLSIMELRWLKTILVESVDSKIDYFLSENERNALKELLEDVNSLPVNKICYYDRYHFPITVSGKENTVFRKIIRAINSQKLLSLTYRSFRDDPKLKEITGMYLPLTVEFSKRNNLFQAYMRSEGDKKIYILNLSRIEKIHVSDKGFTNCDKKEAENALKSFRDKKESVEVIFYGIGDLTDDILSEFSPWEKECVYDKKEGIYHLKIFYHKFDESELIIRLMGYGPDIQIADKGHSIYQDIKKRLEKQAEITRKKTVILEISLENDKTLADRIKKELSEFHFVSRTRKDQSICSLKAMVNLYEEEKLYSRLKEYPADDIKVISK